MYLIDIVGLVGYISQALSHRRQNQAAYCTDLLIFMLFFHPGARLSRRLW